MCDMILETNSSDSQRFELDIFIIVGYQLTGISITTETKANMSKLKGFEVIHRVMQIGGDESKAILVTGIKDYNQIKELLGTLAYETGKPEKNIAVFGIDSWKSIGDEIIEEVFK